jgi:WD40 repeat protein
VGSGSELWRADEMEHPQFTFDDQHVVAVSYSGAVCFLDSKTGALARTVRLSEPAYSLVLSGDSRRALVASRQRLAVFDLDTPVELCSFEAPAPRSFRRCNVAWSPDETHALACMGAWPEAESLVLIDLATGKEAWRYQGTAGGAATQWIAFSHDGRLAATCGDDGTVHLWKLPAPGRAAPGAVQDADGPADSLGRR